MRFEQLVLNRKFLTCWTLAPFLALVACGGGGDEDAMDHDAMEESAPAADAARGPVPRVFFVTPQDGAEISSDFDLSVEFGIENYEISPVPENVESPRARMGHHHLGINTGCLPVGDVVPQGEGWVHFGDGSNSMDLQVEAGAYMLTLQVGDDEHRTQEGLCETINIEIADGI